MTGSGRGNPKIFGLNPPFYISKSATVAVAIAHALLVYRSCAVITVHTADLRVDF